MVDFSLGNDFSAAAVGIGAVGQLFGSQIQSSAYAQEAGLYNQAAQLEQANILYSQESTRVQQIQQMRQANKVIGAQKAAVGGAGFQEAGSNLYLLRDSRAQAGIASGMIGVQGALQQANFQEQALGYQAQAAGATAASKAASTGGILGALGGIAGIVSKFI